MAKPSERLPENIEGDFYVDRSCIDCATCRQIAPAVFAEGANHSYVERQPESDADRRRALMALVACPTHSIGTVSKIDIVPGVRAFPEPIEEEVSFCGFTSEDSFAAWSYFIRRPEGNILVDSPRAAAPLMKRFAEMGGVMADKNPRALLAQALGVGVVAGVRALHLVAEIEQNLGDARHADAANADEMNGAKLARQFHRMDLLGEARPGPPLCF